MPLWHLMIVKPAKTNQRPVFFGVVIFSVVVFNLVIFSLVLALSKSALLTYPKTQSHT